MAGDAIESVNAADYLGKTLDGRYRLDSVLGQGGMGLVFAGVQTSMQRSVAVKTLHPQLAMAPTFFERFKREAELASKLRHPNIITIYDFGRAADGTCYFVMELIEGESLRQQVKREGPMSLRRATAIIEQAALGLQHAHKQNVVHRDVKPHNIMISQVDGHEYVKVLDFGLVKVLEQEDEEQLTSTGQVLGTPQYMPPEQAGGEVVDQRSDLYSLAGVLFFMLTGSSPFGANTVRKALTAALTKTVPAVGSIRQGAPVPRKLDEFFRKGLAREKEDRFQNVAELLTDMNAAMAGETEEVLDALPIVAARTDGVKDSGSGSQSGAEKKGSKAGTGRSSKVIVASSLSKPLPEKVVPQDRRETAPEIPSLKATSTQPALEVVNPPVSGSKLPMVMAAVAAALVIVLGSAYVFLAKKPVVDIAPPPMAQKEEVKAVVNEPVVDTLVTVSLKTRPAGASVIEGGTVLGKTPLERKWTIDEEHALSFELAGHSTVKRTFKISQNEGFEIELPAVKKPASGPPVKKKKDDDIQAFE